MMANKQKGHRESAHEQGSNQRSKVQTIPHNKKNEETMYGFENICKKYC